MFQDLYQVFQWNLSIQQALHNLIVALIGGLIVAFFYRKTYEGPGYLNTFVNTLVILSMITALVIMVIGNNLARAFGLVGAMSIIRFRTAVKETLDIVFIFFALAIGMAAGVGLTKLTLIGSLSIGLIALLLKQTNLLIPTKKEFLLQFVVTSSDKAAELAYQTVLDNYCRSYRLINAKSLGENGDLELSFYVILKPKTNHAEFIRNLRNLKGVKHVNLFFDQEFF